MKGVSSKNLGLIIAFLLPGFIGLWRLFYHSPLVSSWIRGSREAAPAVGGFLYVALPSLAVGLTVNASRWAVMDTLLHRSGISQPSLDSVRLPGRFEEFEGPVGAHSRSTTVGRRTFSPRSKEQARHD